MGVGIFGLAGKSSSFHSVCLLSNFGAYGTERQDFERKILKNSRVTSPYPLARGYHFHPKHPHTCKEMQIYGINF